MLNVMNPSPEFNSIPALERTQFFKVEEYAAAEYCLIQDLNLHTVISQIQKCIDI